MKLSAATSDRELLAAFKWNADGTWSPITETTFGNVTFLPKVKIVPGIRVGDGDLIRHRNALIGRNTYVVRVQVALPDLH
jgi:hypothetical protein